MDVGGQAVIEGVMMRNKEKLAIAVRTPEGDIKVRKEKSTKFPKIFNVPFIRGSIVLGYSMYDGVKALVWSSNQQMEEEEELTKGEIIGTIFFSFLFAALFFVVLPFFTAKFLGQEGFMFNVLDGIFRVTLFLGYLILISLMKDVKILFQYHGAEHKSIACYEAKKSLTVKNARQCSRFHPRCGTTFIFIVLILSILIFSLVIGPWWIKLLGRILLMPVIAGIGYEIIKLGGKHHKNIFVRILIAPGLWLQRITTKEPTDKQLEVGLQSLKEVLDE